ncbi:MAG: pyridoxamine 5'-phosphate oxidase family protein [Pseudomonadota bacterium]
MTRSDNAIWHAGERALQDEAGVRARMEAVGRHAIRPYLQLEDKAFYAQLSCIAIGTVDDRDRPWATLLFGQPGFVHADSFTEMRVATAPPDTDPAASGLQAGRAIGMLGIDLATRRRHRVNGRIGSRAEGGYSVSVDQAMGNCPKYIQTRDTAVDGGVKRGGEKRNLSPAADDVRSRVGRADTFFVASYTDIEDVRLVDASHRGGNPGFVHVDDDGTLTVPDFAGNGFFNTLGNVHLTPFAGLAFPDFDTGELLQLTGEVELVAHDATRLHYAGAERYWRVTPSEVVLRSDAVPVGWTLRAASMYNRRLGPWSSP